ncbi:MAG: hypothetical protein AB1486_27085 [Planctomycetota bacterium]
MRPAGLCHEGPAWEWLVGAWVILLAGLGSAAALGATGQDEYSDDMNPRSPGTPLVIEFRPYTCTRCIQEKRIPDGGSEIRMLRMPVAELVATLGIKGEWFEVATPHFRILSTLEPSSIKLKQGSFVQADLQRLKAIFPELAIGPEGARLDAHQRVHLHHIRAERVYAHFAALSGCEQPYLGMPLPYELYLFQRYADHHNFVDRYVGTALDKAGVQWHFRDQPNFIILSICADLAEQKLGRGDAIVANHVIHNLAHNLIDGHNNYYRETWAWLEEGLGHYYERRETPRYNNFCWAEGAPPEQFVKPDWETTILSLVRRGRDVSLAQWCEKLQPGELSGIENGLSWSIVEFIIKTEPVRFAKLIESIDDLVNNPTSAACIERAFGVSPSVLHQRWRDWVLQNYGKER